MHEKPKNKLLVTKLTTHPMTLLKGKCCTRVLGVRKRWELLYDMMEGRDYGQLKQTDQHADRIASENAYQKPAGNSRILKREIDKYP